MRGGWRQRRLFAKLPAMPMLRVLAVVLLLALAPAATCAAGAQAWRFDPVHTQVTFFVDHLGFAKAAGRLRVSQGWFRFDPDDWSSAAVDVTIDLASVDMGDPRWSETVRSGQFFNTERWPTARFVSRSVDTGGQAPGRAVLRGDLTLHGVSQPLDLAVTFNRIGRDPYAFKRKAGFSAQAIVKRSAFGMTRYAEVVGDEVELRIEVEGIDDDKAATRNEAADGIEKH